MTDPETIRLRQLELEKTIETVVRKDIDTYSVQHEKDEALGSRASLQRLWKIVGVIGTIALALAIGTGNQIIQNLFKGAQ